MSVDFDPVRLRPRRRRIDPVLVGAAVVVLGLVAAVIKPWEPGPPTASAAAPVAAASDAAQPSPALSADPSARGRPASGEVVPARLTPTWGDIRPYATARDAWGVDAIVDDSAGATGAHYRELWSALDRTAAGTYAVEVTAEDRPLVALGVTFPFDEVPQGARIWRVHAGRQLEWIDARQVKGSMAAGSMLFERPGTGGSPSTAWPAGEYRIDVLIDDFIGKIDVRVPTRLAGVPGPDVLPPAPAGLVAAKTVDPSVTGQGPFAVVDGVSVGLTARLGTPLDEPAEWHASIASEDEGAGSIAIAYLPRTTGLGVMFTEHAVVRSIAIRRLVPDDRVEAAPPFGGVSSLHGRTPYVVFTPNGDGVWRPGVYAISASWTDPAGAHAGTWQVELRPGALVGGSAAIGPETGG